MLCSIFLPAQKIHLSLSKDTIGLNETVTLVLSGETNGTVFSVQDPTFEGVSILSEEDNTNVVNRKTTFERTYILSPERIGTFSFGSASVQIGSRHLYSNKVSLVVVASGKSNNNQSANQTINESPGAKDAFLRCEPDKKKVVLGEQVLLSINLYYRVIVKPNPSVYPNPAPNPIDGFYYYEGQIVPKLGDSIVNENGVLYHLTTIYQEFIFPNKTGKIFIPSFKYYGVKLENEFSTGDPMMDELSATPVDTTLISPPVPIDVSPLPDKNKPDNFQGDVGEFSLNSSIDKSHVKANEPVILEVRVKGKGNIGFIQFPPTKFPDGVESYPPVATDTVTQTWDGIIGEKKFKVTLIPRNAGDITIPEISFSYYDPDKKDYVTLKTPEFSLKVDPADSSKDITENNLPESFLDTKSYGKIFRRIAIILIPPVLLILALIFISRRKKKKKELEDAFEKQKEKAVTQDFVITKKSSDIQGMINAAESLIMNGKTKAGIAQLYETLFTAICEKTELTREEASIHQMRFRLEIKHFSKEFASEILSLLQELSELRYSGNPIDTVKLAENIQKVRRLTLSLV